jgi:hypothetical protein
MSTASEWSEKKEIVVLGAGEWPLSQTPMAEKKTKADFGT